MINLYIFLSLVYGLNGHITDQLSIVCQPNKTLFFRWVYICDRKTHSLVTPPYHLTGLQDQEEVELKFTAPGKPGHYGFTVVIRSDSYIGLDVLDDIKLDVKEAREAPTEHPQWEFEVCMAFFFFEV